MRALDRKLLRDVVRLRGQVVTIALVVASGIASFAMLQSTWRSLQSARDAYYEGWRLADVFAQLERAPEPLRTRIEALPGVAATVTRIVKRVRVPLPGESQPPVGVVVSIPDEGEPLLNGLALSAGRMPEGDEILLITKFAEARALAPGDTLPVVLEGVRRELRIAGLALSPEYVYPIAPGGAVAPDDERFAVLWMRRHKLAALSRMEGAFNDVVLRRQPGAPEAEVLAGLDRVLEPYGGLGAVGRERQASNFVLRGELEQIGRLATFIPSIFLAVAAFLLNVVLSRLVLLQRGQIAALKAVGYLDRQIGLHFLGFVSLVVMLGTALGTLLGWFMGRWLTGVYTDVFRFPVPVYRLDASVLATAIVVSLGAGVLGALVTVRQIARLPPAEAMRPPAPAAYRPTLLDRIGLGRALGPASRMIVRELERKPLRALLSALGIAMALAIVILGRFNFDTVEALVERELRQASREDLSIEFVRAVSERSVRELSSLPGVVRAEGLRRVPVRLVKGHRWRDTVVTGYPRGLELRRVVTGRGEVQEVPERGLMLTRILSEQLGIFVGDVVRLEVREGDRRVLEVPVSALSDELIGVQGHMALDELSRLLGQPVRYSAALLRLEEGSESEVRRRLDERPIVIGVTSRPVQIQKLDEQMDRTVLFITLILTAFAATIAVGVVYNNARVALSMRSRDLASLRVLGLTRREIAGILLGELGVHLVLAIPLGLVLGTWMCRVLSEISEPERIRLPMSISHRTYAFAVTVALAAWALGAWLVRRRLDRLDLIGVLKTRE